jgi:hypothetical protein
VHRSVLAWAIGLGPAGASLAWFGVAYGPRLGYPVALAIGAITGVGVLGLTALVVAYLPAALERLGFKRFVAWLRTWWDEDAL